MYFLTIWKVHASAHEQSQINLIIKSDKNEMRV